MAVASHLVDTSALARLRHPSVAHVLLPLGERGLLATSAAVETERLWSAATSSAFAEELTSWPDRFEQLRTDDEDWRRAMVVQGELWRRGQQRAVGWPDLLVAAVAERERITLLHYDADFDLVAAVTGQQTAWVVPRGSVP